MLLDEQYPPNLPVVGACGQCNNGFSRDEEYFAVAVECAVHGTTNPDRVTRPKIARKLREVPSLAKRLAAATEVDLFGASSLRVEVGRVERIVTKLARGHAAYEFGEPMLEPPASVFWCPLVSMGEERLRAFEEPPAAHMFPELGSRAFERGILTNPPGISAGGWIDVQEGRYRYLVSPGPFLVRMVVSEYLAAEVRWD